MHARCSHRTLLAALALVACTETKTGSTVGGRFGLPDVESDGAVLEEIAGTSDVPTGTTDTPAPPPDALTCKPDCVAPQKCVNGTCQLPGKCPPNTWLCHGLKNKKQCLPDGSDYGEIITCPGEEYCTAGKCGIKCQSDPKWGSYVGCAFWVTDLPNYPDPTLNPTPKDLPWAVVVSNPNELPSKVQFTLPPDLLLSEGTIAGNTSEVFYLPGMAITTTGVTKSAVHMAADRPVLVHQFNPWDNKFSNDASLILPEPMLGTDYVILTWPTSPLALVPFPGFPADSQNGYFTVLAPTNGTQVTITVTAHVNAGTGVSELKPGESLTVTLQAGEVLNIEADPTGLFDPMDLSGSTVTSNRPISVFSGHEEAVIGETPKNPNPFPGDPPDNGPCCADHLEEQLLPVNLLGTTYLALKSKPRGSPSEPDYWRVQAAADNVTLKTIPAVPGIDGVVLKAKGNWIEAQFTDSFELQASGPVQVMQYLVSQGATVQFIGDPIDIVAIPIERFRPSYALMVPPKYAESWASVAITAGTTVSLDGVAVPTGTFAPIGSGKWSLGWVKLSEGMHQLTADQKFGATIYGHNGAVGYGFPAGLSLPSE